MWCSRWLTGPHSYSQMHSDNSCGGTREKSHLCPTGSHISQTSNRDLETEILCLSQKVDIGCFLSFFKHLTWFCHVKKETRVSNSDCYLLFQLFPQFLLSCALSWLSSVSEYPNFSQACRRKSITQKGLRTLILFSAPSPFLGHRMALLGMAPDLEWFYLLLVFPTLHTYIKLSECYKLENFLRIQLPRSQLWGLLLHILRDHQESAF